MGVYDTLAVSCPYCGEAVHAQTKCLNNEPDMKILETDSVVDEKRSALFVAKEPCSTCGMQFAIILHNGKIMGAVKSFEIVTERPFGEVESEVVWKGKPNLKK